MPLAPRVPGASGSIDVASPCRPTRHCAHRSSECPRAACDREDTRGTESTVVFAVYLDVAFVYFIEQRGAAFALDEPMHSAKIRDALALEMARKNR
jgi:hypothetical protein